jgi:DNA primase
MTPWISEFVSKCHAQLDERGQEALWERGASSVQIESFSIGYLGERLPEGIEYPADFLKWSRNGDRLVDSFVLPLTNWLGEIKGFQTRSVDREKSGYSDYFSTRAEPVLFGLGQAAPHIWEAESVLVVEGAFDLFPVQRFFPTALATITANIDAQFLRSLQRFVRRVLMFYDDDPMGRKSSYSFKKEYGSEFDVRLISYPSGVVRWDGKLVKDPGELWEVWGDDRLKAFLEGQVG